MAFVSSNPSRFWCGGGVPFEIADDIFLDDTARDIVRDAIDMWNRQASLQLFARFDEEAQPDYVVFTRYPISCNSPIGRQGGAQLIRCPIGGAGVFTAGEVMHEIGHGVGFIHEHCRPDRDQRITINWDNIQPDFAFAFCPNIPDGQVIGDYDYGSIMHYGRQAFTGNGLDTIVPTDPDAIIGQRKGLSLRDIQAIGSLCPTVPDVVDFTANRAAELLRARGLIPSLSGNGSFVSRQSPRAGTVVGRGTRVSLQLRIIRP